MIVAELKTWRQRIATPIKRVGEEKPAEIPSDNRTNRTNPDFLRVSLSEDVIGQTSVLPDKPPDRGPRLLSLGGGRWAEADWARDLCVYCPNPLAPGDVVACVEHQGTVPGLTGQPCLILGCPDPTVDIAYCGRHRRMADVGTLWPHGGDE